MFGLDNNQSARRKE